MAHSVKARKASLLAHSSHLYNNTHSVKIALKREVDVDKRTVTTHSYSLLNRIRFGLYMNSCLFAFCFIGHFLAQIKIWHNWVHVLNVSLRFSIQPSCLEEALFPNSTLCMILRGSQQQEQINRSSSSYYYLHRGYINLLGMNQKGLL